METEEKLEAKCKDIDPTLMSKELPAPMIVKNYVIGENECNYELYLRDFLNESKYFRNKANGETYHASVSEAHGEADAISPSYSIDFKLLISSSKMEAKSMLSERITKISDGAHAFGPSKIRGEKKCTLLCPAIRYREKKDFYDIKRRGPKDFIEKDIWKYLRILCVKKNILLFIPDVFCYTIAHTEKEAIFGIQNALFRDLKESILYREENTLGFETYVATIYDKNMLFFQICGAGIELVDSVLLSKSRIFMNLYRLYDYEFGF
ncbi:MAG: hypothetical protein IJ683_01070 [Butyrivibrio sp.]|nr:hypothetical protein [Butyrivibrio sp.]MBR1640911.1 hypothetical protein [Butyrivibrio sp.]